MKYKLHFKKSLISRFLIIFQQFRFSFYWRKTLEISYEESLRGRYVLEWIEFQKKKKKKKISILFSFVLTQQLIARIWGEKFSFLFVIISFLISSEKNVRRQVCLFVKVVLDDVVKTVVIKEANQFVCLWKLQLMLLLLL